MIAWMTYSVLVGVLVIAAATGVDRLLRLAGKPSRWAWMGATIVAIALAAIAPYRAIGSVAAAVPVTDVAPVSGANAGAAPWWSTLQVAVGDARQLIDAPLFAGVAALSRRLPASAGMFVVGAWLVLSAGLGLVALLVHVRFARALRTWPLADIHGTRVRVSPSTGPVVIGLTHPEIVVPRWMLDRAPSEQRVVLAHEAEHVAARDALLLAGACAAVIAMPWNVPLWFMLSRVRLAVELDCDARVLRRGVAAKTYGTLLIDLAERALPLSVTAAALANDLSHLHKRIFAMKPQVSRFTFLRGSAAAAIGLVGLLAACEAKLPTESDIKQMDATSAERAARQLSLVNAIDTVKYVIDSAVSSELAAKSLAPERIASITLSKPGGGVSTISIKTKAPDGEPSRVEVERERDLTELNGRSLIARAQVSGTSPIFIIDGVRTDQATFAKLDRANIESVEIVKGKAAADLYGAEAEHGVITVTTKPNPAKKGE